MKILICGSRDFNDIMAVRQAVINEHGDNKRITLIIHGAARGADSQGSEVAHRFGIPQQAFPADWTRYGKSAGYKRNMQMLDEAPDLVLAFFAGRRTVGTMHTVNSARQRGIPVKEFGLS